MQKIDELERLSGKRDDVFVYLGDCNEILRQKVLHRAQYRDFKRSLCILDPYGLHLDWEVMYIAGKIRSIEPMIGPVRNIN